MIAGLPWTSWILLIAAVAPGVALVLTCYFSRRRRLRAALGKES